jgi:hypothetical protein
MVFGREDKIRSHSADYPNWLKCQTISHHQPNNADGGVTVMLSSEVSKNLIVAPLSPGHAEQTHMELSV